MTASDVAAATAFIATLGILYETVDLIGERHQICRLLDIKLVRRFLKYDYEARAARIVRQPGTLSLFLTLRVLAAAATVYFFAYQSPLAAVSTAMVIGITYLKYFRVPLGSTGAQMMQRFIWASLFLFALAQGSIAETAVLGFIAFQGLFSYFVAGVSKLRTPSWRDGTAVAQVVATKAYGTSFTATLPHPGISAFLTYSTLVFEIACPFLVLLGVEATLIFFAMGLLFHLGIAVVSGLTAFLFAFPATYPAIYWIVVQASLWG